MLMKHHLRTLPRKTGNKGHATDERRRRQENYTTLRAHAAAGNGG
jgi:hypothetical protein